MKQLDNVELFVCSEDDASAIGFADKVEVWTEGGSSHLILRGVNGVDENAVLQAENECLRRDVEFYKKLWQARGGGTMKPTITESQYRLALDEDRDPQYVYGFADAMHLFGGEVIPDPEPTNREKWVTFLRKVNPDSIMIGDYAEAIVAAGVTAPEDNA